MMKRLTRQPTREATLAKHLAFAFIGAAILAETIMASALIASSDTTASLATAEPLYRIHFAAVAAYCSIVDYADQLLAIVDPTAIAHNLTAFVSERLSAVAPVAIELNNNQIDIVLIGR